MEEDAYTATTRPQGEVGCSLVTEVGIAFPTGPCRRAGVTFSDAEAVIRRGCGDDGEGDWALNAYRERRDREVASLLSWIEAHGLWIEPQVLSGARRGGVEHLILNLDDSERKVVRVAKLTKGESFGFLPTCDDASYSPDNWFPPQPATPAQYLRRMALLDELRPEIETSLEGFARINGTLRIVTSQRFIDPVAASPQSILQFFNGRGFQQVNESVWYHPEHRIALFDVRPANVLTYAGQLYPVDIMPVEPDPCMTALILKALSLKR